MKLTELQDKLENSSLNFSKPVFIFYLLGVYDFPKSRLAILVTGFRKL